MSYLDTGSDMVAWALEEAFLSADVLVHKVVPLLDAVTAVNLAWSCRYLVYSIHASPKERKKALKQSLLLATANGDLATMRYWFPRTLRPILPQFFHLAAENGRVDILRWMVEGLHDRDEMYDKYFTVGVACSAVKGGHDAAFRLVTGLEDETAPARDFSLIFSMISYYQRSSFRRYLFIQEAIDPDFLDESKRRNPWKPRETPSESVREEVATTASEERKDEANGKSDLRLVVMARTQAVFYHSFVDDRQLDKLEFSIASLIKYENVNIILDLIKTDSFSIARIVALTIKTMKPRVMAALLRFMDVRFFFISLSFNL